MVSTVTYEPVTGNSFKRLTCSPWPKLQSNLGAGVERTKLIQRWPNLAKNGSSIGISMGRHSGWRSSVLFNSIPSSVQHWMPIPLASMANIQCFIFKLQLPQICYILMRKTGVDVRSWSTNWPYCMTQVVSVSLGASTSKTTEIDTKRGLKWATRDRLFYEGQ